MAGKSRPTASRGLSPLSTLAVLLLLLLSASFVVAAAKPLLNQPSISDLVTESPSAPTTLNKRAFGYTGSSQRIAKISSPVIQYQGAKWELTENIRVTPTSGEAYITFDRSMPVFLITNLAQYVVDSNNNEITRTYTLYGLQNTSYTETVPIKVNVDSNYTTTNGTFVQNITTITNGTRNVFHEQYSWVPLDSLTPLNTVQNVKVRIDNLHPFESIDWKLGEVPWAVINASSAYQQRINVTNGNASLSMTTNFTINVTNVNTSVLIAAGKMQSTCSDLNIVYNNSGTYTTLDRNLTGCNTTSGYVYIKNQQTIAPSGYDDNYFMIYGDNSTGLNPPHDIYRIWQMADDFPGSSLNSSLWTCTSGTCTVANNMIYLTGNGQQDQLRSVSKFNNRTVMEAYLNETNDGSAVNLLLHGFSNSNADADGDVVWCSVPGVACTNTNPIQVFADRQGSVNYNTANVQNIQASFDYRAIQRQVTSVVYITNNTIAATFSDAKANQSHLNVMYGTRSAAAGYGIYMRNFRAYEWITPAPTTTFGSEVANDASISLQSPASGNGYINGALSFCFIPYAGGAGLANATLYHNGTGTWHANSSNSSVLTSSTQSCIQQTLPNNVTTWNVYVCGTDGVCTFDSTNRTASVNNTLYLNQPSSGGTQTTNTVVFNYTAPNIGNASIKNATLVANWSGSFALNNSNASVIGSGALNSITVAGIPDSVFNWNVLLYDTSGNFTNASSNFTYTVVTTAPSNITLVSPTFANRTNMSQNYIQTNFTFTSVAPTSCSFTFNSTLTSGTITQLTGNQYFCFTNYTSLSDGTYYGRGSVTNAAGTTNSTDLQYNVDTSRPSILVETPKNNSYWSPLPRLVINGTFSDSTSGVANITTNSSIWTQTYTGTSPFNLTNQTTITDGLKSVLITATDYASNTNTSSITFTVDSTTPLMTITSPLNSSYINQDAGITLTGTYSDTNFANVTTNDSRFTTTYTGGSPWSIANNSAIADGLSTILVTTTDLAGNTNSASVTFTADRTKPLITATFPLNSTVWNQLGGINLNGTFSDTNFANITTNDSHWTSTYTSTSPYSIANTSNLTDGNYTVKITATDLANNTNTTTVHFTLDSIPPQITTTYPTNGSFINQQLGLNLNGTYSDTNFANITVNSSNFSTTYTSTSPYSITNNSVLTDGIYTFKITATDRANNTNTSTTHAILLSSTPSITLNAPTNNTNTTSTTITFNFTPNEQLAFTNTTLILANATIFTNITGTWAANNSNTSTVLNGTLNSIQVAGIPNGHYIWGARVCDLAGNCNFSGNNTLIVDAAVPQNLSFVSPTYANTTNASYNWLYINFTAVETNPSVCILQFHNQSDSTTTNFSMTVSKINATTTNCYVNVTSLDSNAYNFSIFINDTAGNQNESVQYTQSVFTPVNFTTLSASPTSAHPSDTVTFTIGMSTNMTIGSYLFESNFSGATANSTVNLVSATSTTATVVTVMPNTVGTYTWRVWANNSLGEWAVSQSQTYTLTAATGSGSGSGSGGSSSSVSFPTSSNTSEVNSSLADSLQATPTPKPFQILGEATLENSIILLSQGQYADSYRVASSWASRPFYNIPNVILVIFFLFSVGLFGTQHYVKSKEYPVLDTRYLAILFIVISLLSVVLFFPVLVDFITVFWNQINMRI